MTRKKDPISFFFGVILLWIFAVGVFGEADSTYIPLDEEAPSTIFQFDLGDSEVRLFAQGYWDLRLSGGIGFGYDSFGRTFSTTEFPGIPYGVVFEQSPDITLSLWLLDRIFLEATVIDTFASSSFLLGYAGKSDEFVQSVRAGNSGTDFGSYGFVSLPNAAPTSLGASAVFASPFSMHELMVRYDPAETVESVFRGHNKVVRTRLAPRQFITGRFFLLPDRYLDDIVVYTETRGGNSAGSDGRYYRRLRDEEMVVDPDSGTLSLHTPPSGRLLVHYRSAGYEIGDEELGHDALIGTSAERLDPNRPLEDFSFSGSYLGESFDTRRVRIHGLDCLLLYEPGFFSPFERYGIYPASYSPPKDNWRIRGYLVEVGSDQGTELQIERFGDDSVRVVSDLDSAGPVLQKCPLIRYLPELYDFKTLPDHGTELLFEILNPVETITVGSDFIAGTVTVFRNGRAAPDATVLSTGEISFTDPLLPHESLKIKYRTNATSFRGGDILFGTGNRFDIGDFFSVDAGFSLRWNIFSGEHTVTPASNVGLITTGTGVRYDGDRVTAGIDGAVTIYSPDTTGMYRLESMSHDSYSISLRGSRLYPASVPMTAIDGVLLTAGDRGMLRYNDYHDYTNTRNAYLRDYSWVPPSDQIYPYTGGSIPGPYVAAGGDEVTGAVAVMDFTVDSGEWVGGMIPMNYGDGSTDMSGYSSFSLAWKGIDLDESCDIVIQIGALGEDLDGDGILDQEDSEFADGFAFDDPNVESSMFIGGGRLAGGDGRIDGEDLDGNDLLDLEDTRLLYTTTITPDQSSYPESEWKRVHIPIPEPSRSILRETRGMRILILNPTATSATARLLLGNLEFHGSSYRTESPPTGSVSLRQIPESEVSIDGSPSLSVQYPSDLLTLSDAGEIQKVLEVRWNGMDSNGFRAEKPIPGVSLGAYKSMSFFYRSPIVDGTNPRLSFALESGSGDGVSLDLPVKNGGWAKVTANLEERTLLVDGKKIADASLTVSEDSATVRWIRIGISGSEGGTCYIDEIHLHRTDIDVSGGAHAFIGLDIPESLIDVGTFPLVSDIHLRQEITAFAPRFAAATGGYISEPLIAGTTLASAQLAFLQVTGRLRSEWNGNALNWSGGHSITGPTWFPPISLSDRYDESEDEFSRSNTLAIRFPGVIDFRAHTAALTFSGPLNQTWDFRLDSDFSIPFDTGVSALFGHTSRDFSADGRNYFHRWVRRYLLLAPFLDTDYPERDFRGSTFAHVTTEPIGIELDMSAGFHTSGFENRSRKEVGDAALALPITVPPNTDRTIALRFEYRREFEENTTLSEGDSFGYDFSGLFSGFGEKRYLYASIPFAEFFDQATKSTFIESIDTQSSAAATGDSYYKPEYSIEVNRPYGSRIVDLLLPFSLRFSLFRKLELEGTFHMDTIGWSMTSRSLALNLFGRLGSLGFIDFYRTDEFSDTITVQGEVERSTGHTMYSLGIQNSFLFWGHLATEFRLEHTFGMEWESDKDKITSEVLDSLSRTLNESASLELSWIRYLRRTIRIPFWEEEFNRISMKNTEILEFSGVYLLDSDSGGDSTRLVTRHDTKFVVEGVGSVGVFIGLGFDWTSIVSDGQSGYNFTIGLHGGVEGRFEF